MSGEKNLTYSLVPPEKDDAELDDELFVDEEDALAGDEEDFVVGGTAEGAATSPSSTASRWIRILHYTWIPEDRFLTFRNQQIIDSVEAIRLMKFFALTAVFIVFVHELVRLFDLEHDKEYGYKEMILYDGQAIILDIVSFYVFGRLYKKKIAVDHLAFAIVLLMGSLYNSALNTVTWLQYSFTMFEIFCTWPWELFLFVGVIVPLFCVTAVKHVQYAVEARQLCMKLLEISLTALFFLLPQISHPNFHLHHWYVGWLIGMHCNFDTWWSRATMAWYWGLYVNGIAVYGRDPLQTCDYAFYISRDTHCSFLKCFVHNQTSGPHNETHTVYNVPDELDWRNCSSGLS
jgi:hypothetical protein